mgnify:FL=1
MLLTVGVVFFLTSNVGAASGWYFANVIRCGGNTANAIVQLTDTAGAPAFTEAWCRLDPGNAKIMMATALTAMSLGKTVYVQMDPALPVPNVTALYINQ